MRFDADVAPDVIRQGGTSLGDASLGEASLGDDRHAHFEAFFARNHRELARLAYLVTGEHAEADDIAADALVAAWRQWDQVRRSTHPGAYVRRMVVNIAATRIRGRVRERRRLLALVPGLSQVAAAADSAAVIDVRGALLALPARRRACVVLRYAFDLSEHEVAQTLGISVGTVKSQTSKAAAQLRAMLGDLVVESASGRRSAR